MQPQLNNKIYSSFLLSIDHEVLSKGSAYTNTSGLLYPATGKIYGLNLYSTPYRQLVNDTSITGANIMSGVYVSGSFISPGISGLSSLNVNEGMAFFNYRPSSVSGVYSIKEFSTYLTTEPEERLLFETKFHPRNLYPQTITGLSQNTQTYPAIFLKPESSENVPLCLGGTDNKIINLRAIVLAESEYQLMAVCNILENMAHKKYKIIDYTDLPFDALGGSTGVGYNYDSGVASTTDETYLVKAKTSNLLITRQYNTLNPDIFPAFIDFELWTILSP